jgi:hypothetical protein
MKPEFSPQIFEKKKLKYQLSSKSVHWEPSWSMQTGWTDMTKQSLFATVIIQPEYTAMTPAIAALFTEQGKLPYHHHYEMASRN